MCGFKDVCVYVCVYKAIPVCLFMQLYNQCMQMYFSLNSYCMLLFVCVVVSLNTIILFFMSDRRLFADVMRVNVEQHSMQTALL